MLKWILLDSVDLDPNPELKQRLLSQHFYLATGFYLDDMPRPTEPAKRSCYEDDITVWASGVNIPELEHIINGYVTEMFCSQQDNSLLQSAPKSTVTLFTPDPMQANTHPKIKISDAERPLFILQSYKEYIWIHYFHLMLIAYKWSTKSVKETIFEDMCRHQLGTTIGDVCSTAPLTPPLWHMKMYGKDLSRRYANWPF